MEGEDGGRYGQGRGQRDVNGGRCRHQIPST